jgi:hypothetical protein
MSFGNRPAERAGGQRLTCLMMVTAGGGEWIVSMRGWTGGVVGLKFRRHQSVWSPAVTHKYRLARPELSETEAPECFHMDKNIGRLRPASQKTKSS